MHEKEIIIHNLKINYIEQNLNKKGPVFVFLHGWGTDKESFTHIYNHEKDAPILALDFPGFGKSSELNQTLTLQDYSKLTTKFIHNKIPDRELILIGHSFGGRVLMKMLSECAQHKKNLHSIIFIDVPFLREKLFFKRHIGIISSAIFRTLVKIPPFSFFADTMRKKIYEIMGTTDYYELGDNHALKETFKNVINEDISQYFKYIQGCKTNIIWGADDRVTKPEVGKHASKVLGVPIYFIDKASHFPFADEPKAFLKIWDKIK